MKASSEYTEAQISEMIEALAEPWDRLSIETDLQYRAFREFFCRLPSQERSVVKAYGKYLESQGKPKVNRANESWYEWYNLFHWVERAKAYDNFLAEETSNFQKHEQMQQLIDFRRRQRDLAGMITDSAALMLSKALEALKNLKPEHIQPRMIPEYVKTAATVAEFAQNAEANAMALSEIVDKLGLEEHAEYDVVDRGDGIYVGVEMGNDNDTQVLTDLLDGFDKDDDDEVEA
jgi:hypothetical protein